MQPWWDLHHARGDRAVRVALGLAVCVMLAVYGRPGLGSDPRCQPQPETHGVLHHRVQLERLALVRLLDVGVRRGLRHAEDVVVPFFSEVCQTQVFIFLPGTLFWLKLRAFMMWC